MFNFPRKEPIPEVFQTIEAAAEFWDGHSLADYIGEYQVLDKWLKSLKGRVLLY